MLNVMESKDKAFRIISDGKDCIIQANRKQYIIPKKTLETFLEIGECTSVYDLQKKMKEESTIELMPVC